MSGANVDTIKRCICVVVIEAREKRTEREGGGE